MKKNTHLFISIIIALIATSTIYWYLGSYTQEYSDDEIEIRELMGEDTKPPLTELQRIGISIVFFIIIFFWFIFVLPKLLKKREK